MVVATVNPVFASVDAKRITKAIKSKLLERLIDIMKIKRDLA